MDQRQQNRTWIAGDRHTCTILQVVVGAAIALLHVLNNLLLDRPCSMENRGWWRRGLGTSARVFFHQGGGQACAYTSRASRPRYMHRPPAAHHTQPAAHPPFMIRRVTVTARCCPSRLHRPMACSSKAGFSTGSHSTTCVPAVSVTPAPPVLRQQRTGDQRRGGRDVQYVVRC